METKPVINMPAPTPPKETTTITIKKDHLFYMIAIVFLVIGLGVGFVLGDKFGDSATGAIAGPQPSPTQPEEPTPRIQASIDDDAILGKTNAPVTIIEFSDFQCPYCGRFATGTLMDIKKNYVDTGKVKLVFRDLPLSFHSNAESAAIAAECAGEQGKYYEFHDKLFANQQNLSIENYKIWAEELGLDIEKFNACLDSEEIKAEVQKDVSDAIAYGITGTPTFLIGNDKNGYVKVVGAQPYDVFKQIIDAELAKAQ
ncbi:MAG: DsbA family protein [Candidatus Nanoarchaeia archaeon]